jgi:transitional endoplasmic reticulum ATPase
MPLAKDIDQAELASKTKSYSGADIDAVCREAALNALRQDINSKEVSLADFHKALEKIGPTISSDMETWYKSFMKAIRRVKKPATPIS